MESIHVYRRLRFSLVSICDRRCLLMIVGLAAWGAPSTQVWSQTKSSIQAESRPSQPEINQAGQPLEVPAKIVRYSKRLMRKYDKNRNGYLEKSEWTKMRGNPRLVDANGDGIITTDELITRVFSYGASRGRRPANAGIREADKLRGAVADSGGVSRNGRIEEASVADIDDASQAESKRRRGLKFYVPMTKLPPGVPPWFLSRDRDGDAQLTLSEFAPSGSRSAVEEFTRRDLNRDGILTGREFVRSAQQNNKATTAQQK